ncbi:MAG: hypothetical protein WDA16_01360, partial [Candidatus Thermoplasmatota archaeon]
MEKRDTVERIAPNAEPSNGRLKDLTRRSIKARRLLVDATVRQLLAFLLPEDAAQLRRCRKFVLRFTDPNGKTDILHAGRCKSSWCPWCTTWDHVARTAYQAAKLASLDPRAKSKPWLVHVVFHIPQPLHEMARQNPLVLGCVRHAIRKTLAEVYGYRVKSIENAERRAWRELGAIFNFHAFGDKATPYPKWSPHYDILVSAFRRRGDKLEPLPNSWPELYERTRERYRAHLRAELLRHVRGKPGWTWDIEVFLHTDFAVDFHVSPNKEKGEGGVIQKSRAIGHIRYSCRPLFNLAHAKFRKDTDGKPLLVYRPKDGSGGPIIHVGPPGPVFGALRALRPWLQGEEARSYHGILHNQAYEDAA